MKLDPRFVKLIYKVTDKDPDLTQTNFENIPEGALWINKKSGKVFIAIKHPNNPTRIVWLSISNTPEDILSQFSFPTYNIVDIFNDNSIVAFYPFDGNAYDLANGYNGTWHGNERYDKGIFGQAARFDGSSYLELPSDIISVFNNYSYSIWIYIPGSVSNWSIVALNARNKFLASDNNQANRKNGLLEIDPNKRLVHFAKGSQDSNQLEKSIDFTPYLNKWVHIVYTQANNTHKVYINGRLIPELTIHTSGSVQLTDVGYTNLAFVHHYKNTIEDYAIGLRDQLRIFNRPLTDEEAIILYNENYLIKKALSILIDKFRTYKEIVFFPAGDVPSIQTGTKFHGGQIGQVTDTKPVIKDTGKETIGKELYFPNNSAIELKFDQNITVPFTLTAIVQVDRLEQTQGIWDKTILGIDYYETPTDGNFDYWIYLHHGKELSVNIGAYNAEQNASESSPKIPISPSRKYLIVNTVKQNEAIFKVYDFETKQIVGDFSFNIEQSLSKLREPRLALGAWIYTSDSGNNYANKFGGYCNCGLHINQFRIFKGTLTNEEINLLLNEDKFYPVRTQYTPRVFVNKPSLNEDLILFYNFDKIDTANKKVIDLSGNGYDGTWNGTPQYDKGIFGRAAKFVGNNWIEIGTNLAQENLINNEFSISIWVKPSVSQQSYDKSSYVGIIHFAQCGSCGCCGTGIGISRSNPRTLNISIADSFCRSEFGKSFANVLDLDKWQHIVLTSKGLYLNGNLVELWTSKTFGNRVDGIAIGATYKDCYASPPPPFTGLLDQLRIYKRALSTDEIQTLYREMLWVIK